MDVIVVASFTFVLVVTVVFVVDIKAVGFAQVDFEFNPTNKTKNVRIAEDLI